MMRMMRKMFKRIVSIVMALLVILGTAVYGGSVFAEAQSQATAPIKMENNCIYLNPEGMGTENNQGPAWTAKNSDIKIYIGFVGIIWRRIY